MLRVHLAITLVVVGLLAACAPTPPVTALTADSSGSIVFESFTLTEAEFTAGARSVRRVTITADLTLPRGRAQVPAVILLHGSGGVSGAETGWARDLVGFGVATLLVDSFTGRGIARWPSEAELSRIGGVVDAYRALELLTTHPRIDGRRIGLMGFSRGGGLTVLAALDRFREVWLPPGADFALYMPVYPNYRNVYVLDDRVSRRPIRVLHGVADDANPITASRSYVARLQRAGADAQLFEYPDAYHSFDNPSLRQLVRAPVPGGGSITVVYDAKAHAQALRDVRATLQASLGVTQ